MVQRPLCTAGISRSPTPTPALANDAKLMGVYSSEQAAQDRIARSANLPRFAEYPDDFLISRYVIDEDQWESGWVEVQFSIQSDRPQSPS